MARETSYCSSCLKKNFNFKVSGRPFLRTGQMPMLGAHTICHVRYCMGGKGYSKEGRRGLIKPTVSLAAVSGSYSIRQLLYYIGPQGLKRPNSHRQQMCILIHYVYLFRNYSNIPFYKCEQVSHLSQRIKDLLLLLLTFGIQEAESSC